MTAKGHILLALLLSSPISMNIQHPEVFISALTLGAVFPDIDEPESSVGRKAPMISFVIKKIFGHRGFTHRLFVPYALFVAALFLGGISKIAMFGFALGYFLHTIGDMMTKSGIESYFWPFWQNRAIYLLPASLRFKTGSIIEMLLITLLALADAVIYSKFVWA